MSPTIPFPRNGHNSFHTKDNGLKTRPYSRMSEEQAAIGRRLGGLRKSEKLLFAQLIDICERLDAVIAEQQTLLHLPALSCVQETCIREYSLILSSRAKTKTGLRPLEGSSSSRVRARGGPVDYTCCPAFCEFWALYPRKDGSKRHALELWQRRVEAYGLESQVLEALKGQIANNWREHLREHELKYIKYPEFWLSGGLWEAEIIKPKLSRDEYFEQKWAEEEKREQETHREGAPVGRQAVSGLGGQR